MYRRVIALLVAGVACHGDPTFSAPPTSTSSVLLQGASTGSGPVAWKLWDAGNPGTWSDADTLLAGAERCVAVPHGVQLLGVTGDLAGVELASGDVYADPSAYPTALQLLLPANLVISVVPQATPGPLMYAQGSVAGCAN